MTESGGDQLLLFDILHIFFTFIKTIINLFKPQKPTDLSCGSGKPSVMEQ